MSDVRALWRESKVYRVFLVLAIIYAGLRLGVQGFYLATMLKPEALPAWVGADEPMIPADLQIYLNAAQHFQDRQDLYLKGSLTRLEDHFPYAPSFAWAFTPFLYLSTAGVSIIHTLLHLIAYWILCIKLKSIFQSWGFTKVNRKLIEILPLWIVFSAFWSDLGYLNIYLIMTLIGTLFVESIINEDLKWSALWGALILHIKPHWAFAIAVPLLLRRYRFFFKMVILTGAIYTAIAGITMLAGGSAYVWQQYHDYIQFLARLSRDFPWRGPEASFLGYNHSIKQIVIYLVEISPRAFQLATVVKIALLLPLGYMVLRYLWKAPRTGPNNYQLSLDWTFALYLGAFIWLDMVWEVSLGIVIFPYLLATTENRSLRAILWIVFLPYALVDLWQVLSFAIFGMGVIAPGPYILTDPSIYLPLTMFVILSFYGLLIKRLCENGTAARLQATPLTLKNSTQLKKGKG